MTLKYLVEQIKKIALLQPNVNTATEGDVYDILNGNPSVKYGVIHLTQTTHRTQEDQDIYGFNIFYIDRLLGDNSNKLQIQSIGKELIYNILKSLDETFDTETSNITFQPFTEKFNDLCAGVYASVNVSSFIDYDCAEQYGEYIKPTFQVINNQDITITDNGTYLPQEGYTGFGKVEVKLDIEDLKEKSYEEGREVGIEEGKNIQKELLTDIVITDNGSYSTPNGYKNVEVNVDTNSFYERGKEEGVEIGKQEIVDDAQVLNVTKNGTYNTKYIEPTIIRPEVTGINADGSNFYDYALVNNKTYNTQIVPTKDTRLEFWFKPDAKDNDWSVVIGASNADNNQSSFQFRLNSTSIAFEYKANIGNSSIAGLDGYSIKLNRDKFAHIIMSIEDGLIVNDVLIGTFEDTDFKPTSTFYINGIQYDNTQKRSDDGYFGMIIIDGNYIVPTEEGFKNLNTNELLPLISEGDIMPLYQYHHKEEEIITYQGELIKQVNVAVESPLKFPNGFVLTKYPLEFDFSNPIFSDITDFGIGFFSGIDMPTKIKNFNPKYSVDCSFTCANTTDIGLENCDFSKCVCFDDFFNNAKFTKEFDVTNLVTNNCYSIRQMFYHCNGYFVGLDSWDTSNIEDMEGLFDNSVINFDGVELWNTSNVNNMRGLFQHCGEIIDLRGWSWDTSKVYNFNIMFYNCKNLEYIFDIDVTTCYNMSLMFWSCGKLREVRFKGNLNFKDKIDTNSMFYACNSLEKIYIPQEYANSYTKIIERKPSQTEIVYY